MTEPTTPTPPAAPASGRGLKIAFAISLAFNLLVLGLIAGAWLRNGPLGHGMPRDLSFGPFTEALSAEDRTAIRETIRDRKDLLRQEREAAKAEFAKLLAELRADPFDPAAFDAALTAIVARSANRLALGQELLAERIGKMASADRLAFADRLEGALRRGARN
ncbi:MAG TPA: periplasmic heavy metal sensor [Tabrizicola sp.]|mgnify:CR=1 FL=1|nr:periplasmic heavy metal sensor [Tabrizicola sp.]